ncbi:hypothetical protein HAX54_014611 [Datura stramonium]|uniref:Uncharacterized protein n=1 Tax=Datura stramonium TaxID=4076 RepID=A0ABS8RZ04_DATST|nr:hypothetical protein [Datura stramonium]
MDFLIRYDYIPRSYLYIGDLLIQWKNQESEYKNPLLYLKTIDLSSNKLVGGIPKEIAEMIGLQSLNLSRNYLNGTVAEGMSQIEDVGWQCSTLWSSSSEVSGYAPSSPSYVRGSNTNPHEHDDDDDDEEFPSLEFYISMVLGFCVAFWGVLGCLIVNHFWRNVYFTFLVDMKSWLHTTFRVCFVRLKGKLRN